MSKIQLNTNLLWDIGKAFEGTQKSAYELADSLESRVKSLNFLEDILQWSDERIEREAREIRDQADRCGLAASYLFKMAENYEQAELMVLGTSSDFISVFQDVVTYNATIYAKYIDENKMDRALQMEYSQQNSEEARLIKYPGGEKFKDATAFKSACGSYALLHAMRYLGKANDLTIQETCAIAVESGARYEGGTWIDDLGKALADEGYDVNVSSRYYSLDDALQQLKNGNAVVASYNYNKFHNSNLDGGHFITLAAISEDGQKVLIIDSDTRNLKFDDNSDGIYWIDIKELGNARSFYTVS